MRSCVGLFKFFNKHACIFLCAACSVCRRKLNCTELTAMSSRECTKCR